VKGDARTGSTRDDLLEGSLALFWRQGYAATSLTDLIGDLRVNGTSIYRIFGSKEELYLEALRRYGEKRRDAVRRSLRAAKPLDAVRTLLHDWADLAADPDRRGCFLVNATLERVPQDRRTAAMVGDFWNALEDELASALERARDDGTLGGEKDVRALAGLLLAVMQGMMVVGKVDPDADHLHRLAGDALTLLG